jgi:hypothetical protein
MWSLLIRGGVAVVALAALWLVTARWCSLLIDHVYTVPLATLPSTPVGWDGAFLQFGSDAQGAYGPKGWDGPDLGKGAHVLELTGPGPSYQQAAAAEVDANHRLVVSAGGRSLALGPRTGALPGAEGPVPAFSADPGDKTSMTIERSWLSWPTPFDLNFMTGQSSSWRRHLYYRLSWKKASGARLDMLWRFEQGFDAVNGWKSAGGGESPTGLIRVDIRLAPAPREGP